MSGFLFSPQSASCFNLLHPPPFQWGPFVHIFWDGIHGTWMDWTSSEFLHNNDIVNHLLNMYPSATINFQLSEFTSIKSCTRSKDKMYIFFLRSILIVVITCRDCIRRGLICYDLAQSCIYCGVSQGDNILRQRVYVVFARVHDEHALVGHKEHEATSTEARSQTDTGRKEEFSKSSDQSKQFPQRKAPQTHTHNQLIAPARLQCCWEDCSNKGR